MPVTSTAVATILVTETTTFRQVVFLVVGPGLAAFGFTFFTDWLLAAFAKQ